MLKTTNLSPHVTTRTTTDTADSTRPRQRTANSPQPPAGPRPMPAPLGQLRSHASTSANGDARTGRNGATFSASTSGTQNGQRPLIKTRAPDKPLPALPPSSDEAGPSHAAPSSTASRINAPSQPPSRTPSIAEATDTAPNDAPQDPGFRLPARSQRLGQPVYRDKPGFSLLETNKLRPDASVAGAIGIGTHSTAGAATGAVVGGSLTAAHEAVGALVNGHAFFAARERKQRYGEQLDSMLQNDLKKFQSDINNGVPIRPETMILKRKNGIQKTSDLFTKPASNAAENAQTNARTKTRPNAELDYDMDAVRKLAASDDPELKQEAAHAKNVLLTAFLKDDVAAKQGNRAAYEFIRNTVAIGAATATAVGTHGASVAAAGSHAAATAASERIAGSALAGAGALDVAKGIRGLKQRMRDEKAEVAGSYELHKRKAFADSVVGENADPQMKQAFDDLGDARDKLIKDTHLAFRQQAHTQAGQERYGKIFPGTMIDERKSTAAKKETRDLVGKHAHAVVEYQIGLGDPAKQKTLANQWNTIMQSGGTRQTRARQFAAIIDADPGMKNAYQLLRDTGMGRSESIYTMQRMVEMSIESKLARDPEMATFGGNADFAKDDAAQKATASRLTSAFARR
ncbi:hypothetical protein PPGU19_060690 (plasmid) [Paraburkholderia sp. PGU19]|uniref:hypothetical protein n=1 Tax=Paraburkholderia sp. PGU19 TaxID=2735434 RepID=UPI0015D99028|nr:hypothetical protein [Paraburkholderia sp. PGU19]BCG01501.1 hypothetical protein PPGU19_060690 [Paraburkholderia sp. PGU19]